MGFDRFISQSVDVDLVVVMVTVMVMNFLKTILMEQQQPKRTLPLQQNARTPKMIYNRPTQRPSSNMESTWGMPYKLGSNMPSTRSPHRIDMFNLPTKRKCKCSTEKKNQGWFHSLPLTTTTTRKQIAPKPRSCDHPALVMTSPTTRKQIASKPPQHRSCDHPALVIFHSHGKHAAQLSFQQLSALDGRETVVEILFNSNDRVGDEFLITNTTIMRLGNLQGLRWVPVQSFYPKCEQVHRKKTTHDVIYVINYRADFKAKECKLEIIIVTVNLEQAWRSIQTWAIILSRC